MSALPTLRLGRPFGVPIGIQIGWFAQTAILGFLMARLFMRLPGTTQADAYLAAAATVLLINASVMLHELGHALAARRNAVAVHGIDLGLVGGATHIERPDAPRKELEISAGGPLATLVIVLIGIAFGALATTDLSLFDLLLGTGAQGSTLPVTISPWSVVIALSALLLAFNLIPAFPLDGGYIARAIAWKLTGGMLRATRMVARLGKVVACLMVALVPALLIWGSGREALIGVVLLVTAWLIVRGSRDEYALSTLVDRIGGVQIADLIGGELTPIAADASVAVARDRLTQCDHDWLAVVDGEQRFVGLVMRARVDAEIAAGRPLLHVDEILEPGGARRCVDERETLLRVADLTADGELRVEFVVVDETGSLRGQLSEAKLRLAVSGESA